MPAKKAAVKPVPPAEGVDPVTTNTEAKVEYVAPPLAMDPAVMQDKAEVHFAFEP